MWFSWIPVEVDVTETARRLLIPAVNILCSSQPLSPVHSLFIQVPGLHMEMRLVSR